MGSTYLFRLCELATNAVEVLNTLSWVIVAQDLGVELAQTLGFILCKFIASSKALHLLDEVLVRFLVSLSVAQLRGQPSEIRVRPSSSQKMRVEAERLTARSPRAERPRPLCASAPSALNAD